MRPGSFSAKTARSSKRGLPAVRPKRHLTAVACWNVCEPQLRAAAGACGFGPSPDLKHPSFPAVQAALSPVVLSPHCRDAREGATTTFLDLLHPLAYCLRAHSFIMIAEGQHCLSAESEGSWRQTLGS
jgi:hypothetical protein